MSWLRRSDIAKINLTIRVDVWIYLKLSLVLILDILHRSFLLLIIPTSINILEVAVVSRILFNLKVHGVLVIVPGLIIFGCRNLLAVCKIVSAVLRFLSLKLLRAISIGSR